MPPHQNSRVLLWTPPAFAGPQDGTWTTATLGPLIGEGGTASVYTLPGPAGPEWVVKIMTHAFTSADKDAIWWKWKRMAQMYLTLANKLTCAIFPDSLVLTEKRVNPQALIGCRMPYVKNAKPLIALQQHPDDLMRDKILPKADFATLKTIAYNLITGVEAMHSANILLGDPNANNVLVDPRTLGVTFIDPDSFVAPLQITVNGRREMKSFPPTGTTPGYRAPRVAMATGNGGRLSDYRRQDDEYVLAIHLFSLMVPGFHPFNLSHANAEEAESKMINRQYPYAADQKLPDCLQKKMLAALPGNLREGFHLAFARHDPPSASDWRRRFKQNWRSLR